MPGIQTRNLKTALRFQDAQADDARLVLRLIFDGCQWEGCALNYTKLSAIERDDNGVVHAVQLQDSQCKKGRKVKTKAIINATGPFAEQFQSSQKKGYHIRPLRGSHLVFPGDCIPVREVISFIHPEDKRVVFLFPWENVVLLGTTEVDHDQDLEIEPRVSEEEAKYLIEGLSHILPERNITLKDCIASFAGVRPVLSKKRKTASTESREHVVWKDKGLVTITGGKLTTFRILAKNALFAAQKQISPQKKCGQINRWLSRHMVDHGLALSSGCSQRLLDRYGAYAWPKYKKYNRHEKSDVDLFQPIEGTQSLWAEIVYAAEHEKICHLSDLLLRRVRIGLLLPDGGAHLLDRIHQLCRSYLDWSREKWEIEKKEYQRQWQAFYSPPEANLEER